MSKFRKSKSKLAVALLGTLFCNVNGASAINTGDLSRGGSNLVECATSGNISINNSNNNKFFDYIKNHKWQLSVGGLSVATVATLAIVGGKYLSEKNDDPGKDPNKNKKENKENEKSKKSKESKDEVQNEQKPTEEKNQENIQFPYRQENLDLISSAGIPEGLNFNCRDVFFKIMSFIVRGGLNSNDACKDIVDALLGRKKLESFEFALRQSSSNPVKNLKNKCAAILTADGTIYAININYDAKFEIAKYDSKHENYVRITDKIVVQQN